MVNADGGSEGGIWKKEGLKRVGEESDGFVDKFGFLRMGFFSSFLFLYFLVFPFFSERERVCVCLLLVMG